MSSVWLRGRSLIILKFVPWKNLEMVLEIKNLRNIKDANGFFKSLVKFAINTFKHTSHWFLLSYDFAPFLYNN